MNTFRFPETAPHAVAPVGRPQGPCRRILPGRLPVQAPREDPELAEVFLYTRSISYDPDETVEFQGLTTAERWTIQIYRDGWKSEMAQEAFDLPGNYQFGAGEVLTAGSREWIMGLTRRDPFTEQIKRNALDRFGGLET